MSNDLNTDNVIEFSDKVELTQEEENLLKEDVSEDPKEQFYTTPPNLVNIAQSCLNIIKNIFPDANEEQMVAVREQVIKPIILGLLHEMGLHVTLLADNISPVLRTAPTVDPTTRFMADHTITAMYSIIHGFDPAKNSEQFLQDKQLLDYSWNTSIENFEIPPNGIPIEFVLNNKIHRGKLCYYSYLTEDGINQVVTDIPAYWSNDTKSFVYTHAVVYWRELTEPTVKPKLTVVPESTDEGEAVGTAE